MEINPACVSVVGTLSGVIVVMARHVLVLQDEIKKRADHARQRERELYEHLQTLKDRD